MIVGSFAYGNIGTWTTPPTAITTSSQVFNSSDVFSCYIKRTNQIAFSWADGSLIPTMIVYNAQTPSFSSLIQSTNLGDLAQSQVYPTVDTGSNQVFLSIVGFDCYIYYSTYLYLTPSIPTGGGCFSCYNSKNGDMIFNWVDYTINLPTFITLNNSTGPAANSTTISTSPAASVEVMSCYNSNLNQLVFSWNSVNNYYPYYAIYNGSYTEIASGAISSKHPAKGDVFCANNQSGNQTVFSFANQTNSLPFYAIYDHILGKITIVDVITYSSQVGDTVCCCYNSRLNQYVFSWTDLTTTAPYYAIYDIDAGTVVESGFIPSGSTVVNDVNCCYNHALNQVVFNWTDNTHQYPFYAIYTMPIPSHLQRGDLLDAAKYNNKRYLKKITE